MFACTTKVSASVKLARDSVLIVASALRGRYRRFTSPQPRLVELLRYREYRANCWTQHQLCRSLELCNCASFGLPLWDKHHVHTRAAPPSWPSNKCRDSLLRQSASNLIDTSKPTKLPPNGPHQAQVRSSSAIQHRESF